ncbi:MAG: glycosyltransferase [Clostridia bacterium]
MTKPIRILYVNGGSLDFGGISTFLLSYAQRFDPTRVRVDFAVHGPNRGPREQDALALGANIIHIPYQRTDYAGNRRMLLATFSGGYDIVHAHMDGMNGYVLALAKKAGIPVRISHSHNTQFLTTDPIRIGLHRMTANRIPKMATALFACSEAAGRFLYGDTNFDAGSVTIIKNAIELGRFRYDETVRTRLRSEFALNEQFVIGHVGRYDYQKNQEFLLSILPEILKKCPKTMLMCVGDGLERAKLETIIALKGLQNHVLLTGFRNDVPQLMSTFDTFVLPSRFEGLGIVLIEAQRNGLHCIASTDVPQKETFVTDCTYLPLQMPDAWVRALTVQQPAYNRTLTDEPFRAAGYDIDNEAEKLQKLYWELMAK